MILDFTKTVTIFVAALVFSLSLVTADCNGGLANPIQLSDLQGGFEWKDDGSDVTCTWIIDVTTPDQEEAGLVLYFPNISLERGLTPDDDDTVTVYSGLNPTPQTVLRTIQGSLNTGPILVNASQVVIVLIAHRKNFTELDDGNSTQTNQSSFTNPSSSNDHILETGHGQNFTQMDDDGNVTEENQNSFSSPNSTETNPNPFSNPSSTQTNQNSFSNPNSTETNQNSFSNPNSTNPNPFSNPSPLSDHEEESSSYFSLRYEAIPISQFPPALDLNGFYYNCSTPYTIPEAFICDMVEQCLGGEDEKNCSYHSVECGPGWIPYGKVFCLRMVYPERSPGILGLLDENVGDGENVGDVGENGGESVGEKDTQNYARQKIKLSPADASSLCGDLGYSALAVLHTEESRKLAASVASIAGYDEVHVGIRKAYLPYVASHLYRFLWVWALYARQVVDMEEPRLELQGPGLDCAVLKTYPHVHLKPVLCDRKSRAAVACMKLTSSLLTATTTATEELVYPNVSVSIPYPTKTCLDGSYTHAFGKCGYFEEYGKQQLLGDSLRQTFTCENLRSARYTSICDGYEDCSDGSDEDYCFLTQFDFLGKQYFGCMSDEVIPRAQRCDGKPNCADSSDELNCVSCSSGLIMYPEIGCLPEEYSQLGLLQKFLDFDKAFDGDYDDLVIRKVWQKESREKKSGLKVVNFDGYGRALISYVDSEECPETHYRCPSRLCVPAYVLSNIMLNCEFPYADDERRGSKTSPCPGHFRCSSFSICLHPDHVCDGIVQCADGYDERYCNLTCPEGCSCIGYEFKCTKVFKIEQELMIKYLDWSGVYKPPVADLQHASLIRYLNLSRCQLSDDTVFPGLLLVTVLDLSYNNLMTTNFQDLTDFYQIRFLYLAGNPFVEHLTPSAMRNVIPRSQINILTLSVAEMGMRSIAGQTFRNFTNLEELELHGNPIKYFERDTFTGLRSLKVLTADDSRLCCLHRSTYPEETQILVCHAPVDELSSCDDLLKITFLRATLWVQAAMAVVGNLGVFLYRTFFESQLRSTSFRTLVTNLCLADLLMGVYLVIIGSADARFRGNYLWEMTNWVESGLCKTAGFFALVSSEVSSFIICLITVDRFIVLRYPFKNELHLTWKSAWWLGGACWVVGILLAAVPLFPTTAHWEFYGQTGICLPLPITRNQHPGQDFAFGIYIVLNFLLFLVVGAGQVGIYLSVRSGSSVMDKTEGAKRDLAVARRLLLIASTNFCCWFPVGIMGLLAKGGTPIPGEVSVWTAVFILPLNSALNPFLYTINSLVQRRSEQRAKKKLERTLKTLHVEMHKWPVDRLQEHRRYVDNILQKKFKLSTSRDSVRDSSDVNGTDVTDITVSELGPGSDATGSSVCSLENGVLQSSKL